MAKRWILFLLVLSAISSAYSYNYFQKRPIAVGGELK